MRKLVIAAAALASLAVVGTASAGGFDRPCTDAAPSSWLSLQALQNKVAAQGYAVQKAKLKRACGEIYARDAEGTRVELFVDPTSGEIVGKL